MWSSQTGRRELSDEEAEKEWGKEIVEEFAKKAAAYLEENKAVLMKKGK